MIVGDIVERSISPSPSSRPSPPPQPLHNGSNGFPSARHGFSKTQGEITTASSRIVRVGSGGPDHILKSTSEEIPEIEVVQAGPFRLSATSQPSTRISDVSSRENSRRVQDMGEAGREEERKELEERFGGRVLEALKKRAESRHRVKEKLVGAMYDSTRSPAVFSPEASSNPAVAEPDSSPSNLKDRYFPDLATETRKLAWMYPPITESSDSSIRFDISGTALSETAKKDLPSSLGLHHHGNSPDLAGYTLQDILYLCRSTVLSQRVTMLGVLAKITSKYVYDSAAIPNDDVKLLCEKEKIREKGEALALEVFWSSNRSLGIVRAATDLLYEALGGNTWQWFEEDVVAEAFGIDITAADRSQKILEDLPFETLSSKLNELLVRDSGLPPITILQMILILRRVARHSPRLAETICPIVSDVIRSHVLERPWPLEARLEPSIDALRLLRDVITSSRSCALALVGRDIHTSLLRYVIPSTWTPAIECRIIATEVWRILYTFGRYGLCSSIAVSARDILRDLESWISRQPSLSEVTSHLVSAYYDCLTVWTTCAIDPHQTTPEHDLTWSQVSPMAWVDDALRSFEAVSGQSHSNRIMLSILHTVVASVKGAEINGVRGGQGEKAEVLACLRRAGLPSAIAQMPLVFSDHTSSGVYYDIFALLIWLHIKLSPHSHSDDRLLPLDFVQNLLSLRLDSSDRPSLHLRYELLGLLRSSDVFMWRQKAFELMLEFGSGDEPMAMEVLDDLLRADWSPVVHALTPPISSLSHHDGLLVLRPLLQYLVLPDRSQVIGPTIPSHLYIRATSSLRPPRKSQKGLPLREDWVFSPLDELLSSATSSAVAQAPSDWNASELDIVRATLLLAQLNPKHLSRTYTLVNLMKVFMLEHGQQTPYTSEADIFRDPAVSDAVITLLNPLLHPSDVPIPLLRTMQDALTLSSGEDFPFLRYYSDFVTLYEAISFSHPVFSQLLLPPLAMVYPVDYRKLVWVEQPTALRSMRNQIKDVPLEYGSLRVYFEPREEDADVLAGYTRALIRGWVTESTTEFLFVLAVVHLSALLWERKEEGRDCPRTNLLVALLRSAKDAVLKRLLGQDLSDPGKALMVDQEERKRRLEIVGRLAGSKGSHRLSAVW